MLFASSCTFSLYWIILSVGVLLSAGYSLFPVRSFCGFCYRIYRSPHYFIYVWIQIVIFAANVAIHRCSYTYEIFLFCRAFTSMHTRTYVFEFNWSVSDCLWGDAFDIYAIRSIFNFRLQFSWHHYRSTYLRVSEWVSEYAVVDSHASVTCITLRRHRFERNLFCYCRRSNWYRSIVKWHRKNHKFQNEIHNVIKPMLNTPYVYKYMWSLDRSNSILETNWMLPMKPMTETGGNC